MQRREKNPNIEFVKEPIWIDGQKYYQIKCIREYKCSFNKRIIKAGELGGYFHELSIDENEPSIWIENTNMVGAPICEVGHVTQMHRERFIHSNILSFRPRIKIMSDTWQMYFGTPEPSMINAVMYKSANILLLIDEIYQLEERIDKNGFINEMQTILLWLMLGSILDAFLKIHATIFRNSEIFVTQYTNRKEAWKDKSSNIIRYIEKRKDLTREDCIILEQINNNRNYIHFLNNESPFDYEKYIQYLNDMFHIFDKLFIEQKKLKGLS